jgi:hypothetical protein
VHNGPACFLKFHCTQLEDRQTQIMRLPPALFLSACIALCAARAQAADSPAWVDFNPPVDSFRDSPIDLRGLNESFAGENGVIATRGDEFIHSRTGKPVRFWGVNGPPGSLKGEDLQWCARRLAKYGVNLVRLHSAIFDKTASVDTAKVARAQSVVAAMRAEGIYSHFSIYFPLWLSPSADHPLLHGYDGKKHPFAALMFNPEFQERYRSWWKALLLTPDANGRRLVDEPAVFGLEVQNEDSFFFWTFNPDQIPDEQMRILEAQFAEWLRKRYGSLDEALKQWKGQTAKRDDLKEGRVGFRPLWNVFNERTARDTDTVRFLFETQHQFYVETVRLLRSLGFKGVITASNWATASPEYFGPLEKWSYTAGDFVDRHGYFSVTHRGENAEWSIRNGHTYTDRSALRFEPGVPGKPKSFVHPAMDITYDNKPTMISETTWNRPNRFRSEAPLYFASYGALQGSDAIVHFALDGANWSVKPGFWMQPWTLMAPSQMAQFPAAALLYRRGLVKAGPVLARIELNTNDLLNLQGTPLPQDASFDELRLKDVPSGTEIKRGQRVDPLIHYAGRVNVSFTNGPGRSTLTDLKPFIERATSTVKSSTGELTLDYGKGLLQVNAPAAQGASGNLKAAGEIGLTDVAIQSDLDNAHVMVVSLDGEPIRQSARLLVQAMSEEASTGFATEAATNGLKRITNIGRDPWRIKALNGTVRFATGAAVRIQPLDYNGEPVGSGYDGRELKLEPQSIYYLVTRSR